MYCWLRCAFRIVLLALLLAGNLLAQEVRPVVATTGMVGDIVSRVGGDAVSVTNLIKSGVDPHLFKPGRSDIARLSSADMVFYSGLMLEGKLISAIDRLTQAGRKAHALTALIDSGYLLDSEDHAGHPDPHVWMDPSAWLKTVAQVRGRLSELYPGRVEMFAQNAVLLEKELLELDAYAERVLNTIPAESRVLVTAHDAFRYFSRRYSLEVFGIQGMNTESEAGLRDIERAVELLVSRKIQAVFVESTVSDRNARALINGARARGHQVRIGGELFSDAMGAPGTYEGTYIGMIDHNVTLITRALGGQAPERGLNDKLAFTKGEE